MIITWSLDCDYHNDYVCCDFLLASSMYDIHPSMWFWYWNEHGCLPLHIILLPSNLTSKKTIMHESTLIEGHLHKLLLLQAQLMRFQVAPMYVLVQKVSGPVEIIHNPFDLHLSNNVFCLQNIV